MKIETIGPIWDNPYLWDCWFFTDKHTGMMHKFQLAAPNIVTAVQRHHAASIHHATSKDLTTWEDHGIILQPEGDDQGWDNVALWTGSVIERDGKILMYYTSRHYSKFWTQKIGVAEAEDASCQVWSKSKDGPVLEADELLYTMPDKLFAIGSPYGFRDPFAFVNPHDGKHYIAFTGNDKSKILFSGCVGLASAEDPLKPVLLPPICSPEHYWEMEVPQIVFHDGLVYLFFSCGITRYHPVWRINHPEILQGGLHCYVSDNLFGCFKPVNGNGVVFDRGVEEYAHALVRQEDDLVTMIGFLSNEKYGPLQGGPTPARKFRLLGDRVQPL